MSSVFHITKQIKTDWRKDEVFDYIKEVMDDECKEQDPKLTELVEELEKEYPCISKMSTYTQDELDEIDFIWADGPLFDNIDGEIFSFSLVYDALEEPLEFIISTANKYGYLVASEEYDKVWLVSE